MESNVAILLNLSLMITIDGLWIILLILLKTSTCEGQYCSISLPNNYRYGHIYTNIFRWKQPVVSQWKSNGESISHGDVVRFTCENGFIKEELIGHSYIFMCRNGLFNGTFTYDDLMCKSDYHRNTLVMPARYLYSNLFACCGLGLQLYQVNRMREDGSCKALYQVCFDTTVMRPKFSFQPPRNEVPFRTNGSRMDVWGLDYFGSNAIEKLKLSKGYVTKYQKILLSNAFPKRYNKKNRYPYTFDRGHLAPYADFVDIDDKRASCQYINIAPQWNEFNRNTWSVVERITRDLVKENPTIWEIYTGTFGSIPTERGPLYISPLFNQNGVFIKGFVPIPRLYWKVVRNILNKNESIVFVGINNPELKSPETFNRGYLVCRPKCLKNGKYFLGNEFKGFVYMCDFDEFIKRLAKDEKIIRVSIPLIPRPINPFLKICCLAAQ